MYSSSALRICTVSQVTMSTPHFQAFSKADEQTEKLFELQRCKRQLEQENSSLKVAVSHVEVRKFNEVLCVLCENLGIGVQIYACMHHNL